MSFRERLHELTTPEEVDAFLAANPNCALFKAGGCHKTMQGFGVVEKMMTPRTELSLGLVKVIDNRPASNRIAELTEIVHESPQFILFKEGKAIYDVDNWDIVPEALEAALIQHYGPVETDGAAALSHAGDIEHYVHLLQSYTDGQIDEESFTKEWLEAFRADNSLRSTEEFSLLNSLFGDVDAALAIVHNGDSLESNSLKSRAEGLLQQITSR